MKVKNMTSPKTGRGVPNQFVITRDDEDGYYEVFQSYSHPIVEKHWYKGQLTVYIDENYWNCSVTTSKYRNQFLGETTKETQAKIDSGEYILTDLN